MQMVHARLPPGCAEINWIKIEYSIRVRVSLSRAHDVAQAKQTNTTRLLQDTIASQDVAAAGLGNAGAASTVCPAKARASTQRSNWPRIRCASGSARVGRFGEVRHEGASIVCDRIVRDSNVIRLI